MAASLDSKQVQKQLEKLINIDPELMSGTPVFRGTRVPIQFLFDHLEKASLEEFLDSYETVSREQAIELIRLVFHSLLPKADQQKKQKMIHHEVVA